MTSYENMNILEPIDPLNISFSQDKCVKTPQTLQSEKTSNKECPKILIKDPQQLFGHENKNRSFTSPKKLSYLSKTHYQTARKYQDVYISSKRSPMMQLQTWNRRYSSYKQAQPVRNIGKVNPSDHLKEIKKLDVLIKRINDRIEVSKKFFP